MTTSRFCPSGQGAAPRLFWDLQLKGLPAHELFELGDTGTLLAEALLALEEERQPLVEDVLPVGEEARAELVLAAQLGLGTATGDQVKDDPDLEFDGERSPRTSWHDQGSPQGPVLHIVLVSPEGRTAIGLNSTGFAKVG
jgi:hypothetical protein